MADRHALVTGPITGMVDTPHPDSPQDTVDVTAPVLYFDDPRHVELVAEAIERMHVANGTHPTQLECGFLDDPKHHSGGISVERRDQHKAAHAALNERMGS